MSSGSGDSKRISAPLTGCTNRPRTPGRPRPGYIETVVSAARAWDLPKDYVRSLERWAPSS